jgi:hypothetical protein
MTKLEAVIERLKALPADEQEEIADIVDDVLDQKEAGEFTLSPAQEAELARRLAGPDDYASDDEVKAFFARHEK